MVVGDWELMAGLLNPMTANLVRWKRELAAGNHGYLIPCQSSRSGRLRPGMWPALRVPRYDALICELQGGYDRQDVYGLRRHSDHLNNN